jgi:hypothetical protein
MVTNSIDNEISEVHMSDVLMSNGSIKTIPFEPSQLFQSRDTTHGESINSAIKSFLLDQYVVTGNTADRITHKSMCKRFVSFWQNTMKPDIQNSVTMEELTHALCSHVLLSGNYISESNHLLWTGIQLKRRVEL